MIFQGFAEGIKRIWEQDKEAQEFYLNNIGQDTRKLPVEAFKKFNAVFVPNDGYLSFFFGVECTNYQYELYTSDGLCNVANYIIFPCYDLLGMVTGWISYKPFVRLKAEEENNWDTHYYEYPTAMTFNKGKYVFTLPSIYENALKDGYIIITDGVFDTVSFVHYGFNACSLLGSQFNINLGFYFNFIPKIFVSIDNDEAGYKLYQSIKRIFPNAKKLVQTVDKDSDGILKTEYRDEYIKAVKNGIERDVDIVFRQKFRRV